jgi:phosphatidylethanolamine-binding protein (PEBP) family uncharacterized protein
MKCLRSVAVLVTALNGCLTLAGCSADADSEGVLDEASQAVSKSCKGNHHGHQGQFWLSSPAFDSGDPLPAAFSCEGKVFADGTSPKLDFSKGPKGTKSYAIVFHDLTIIENRNGLSPAPNKNLGYHWAIWNVPHNTHTLPASLPSVQFPLGNSAEQLSGGPGGPTAYFGPCPSWQTYCTDGAVPRSTDEYSFTLYALPEELVTPPYDPNSLDPDTGRAKSKIRQYDEFFEANALAATDLLTTSDAMPTSFPQVPNAVCAKNP